MDERDERDDYSGGQSHGRETFLVALLILFMGGGLLLFLILASGGFFGWVVIIALALGLFAGLHYLLWGRRFSEEVQREREALEAHEQPEPWETATRPPWERRF